MKSGPCQYRNLLELGLHFEQRDPAVNARLLAYFDAHAIAIKAELGERVEVEPWDKGWAKVYETWPLEPFEPPFVEKVAGRLAQMIAYLQPLLADFDACPKFEGPGQAAWREAAGHVIIFPSVPISLNLKVINTYALPHYRRGRFHRLGSGQSPGSQRSPRPGDRRFERRRSRPPLAQRQLHAGRCDRQTQAVAIAQQCGLCVSPGGTGVGARVDSLPQGIRCRERGRHRRPHGGYA